MSFIVEASDGQARAGRLKLAHGEVPTPIFMPVGTYGTVKAMTPRELQAVGARIVLGNTFHLWLRPGLDVIQKHGGLHRLMGWPGPILTDSGGFQVFSLESLRKLNDEGVVFRSPVDGSERHLTPEQSMAIQAALQSDVAMAFDHCPPGNADRETLQAAMARTSKWAERCLAAPRPAGQLRFGIVQGGAHADLRLAHLAQICALPFEGFALGGFSVGEPVPVMHRLVAEVAPRLPAERPRYLMGVGTPLDLVRAIASGIDMFDCVLPTRNARNGQLFTSEGKLVISHARFREDVGPLDPACACETCKSFSRGYLRHLHQCKEILYSRAATLHNLTYYLSLVRGARRAIFEGRFAEFQAGLEALWGDGEDAQATALNLDAE
jgi:queuine tRNA-ribosyltransferase